MQITHVRFDGVPERGIFAGQDHFTAWAARPQDDVYPAVRLTFAVDQDGLVEIEELWSLPHGRQTQVVALDLSQPRFEALARVIVKRARRSRIDDRLDRPIHFDA